MLRPASFNHPSVPTRNLPYTAAGEARISEENGGVLSTWQIVWTETSCGFNAPSRSAVVFVDGIGQIVVDAHCLMSISLQGMDELKLSPEPAAAATERLPSEMPR